MSSPSVRSDSPPPSLMRSRRKTPKAPEMITSPFIADQAIRAPRKLRRYSAVWLACVPPRATCGTATALCSITAPFANRTWARVAAAYVVAQDSPGRDLHPVADGQLDQIERGVERRRRSVLRTVVDDHDL